MSSCAKYTMWFPSPLVVFSADSSGKYLHACLSPATWSVHWSWWWRRTTWSCTWTEPRPTGGCPASVGWRNAIRWLTEGERRRSAAERRSATMPPSDVRSCACLQAQEELEILHYSASVVVHQDDSSCHQALHQVKSLLFISRGCGESLTVPLSMSICTYKHGALQCVGKENTLKLVIYSSTLGLLNSCF